MTLIPVACKTEVETVPGPSPVKKDAWTPLPDVRVGGVLGERLGLWREHRLWRIANDPFILEGFESPPGTHSWQGEHVGKWLHAATLAYEATHDEKLLERLQDTVKRLLAAQQDNGYLGTYAPDKRFYAPPGKHTRYTWDIWTHRYIIYGLLTYEGYHPDPAVVEACTRVGDLLLETFGPGGQDLTATGTRRGISSSTLLESIMMLYERTGEERFLEFARHIHGCMEANDQLRVVSVLTGGGDVSGPGDGKAYQLMAVLLGYGDLYRFTGTTEYLEVGVKGWENIRAHHTYETGGPWSFQTAKTNNRECFAPEEFYHPSNVVETCSTTTWVQLSMQLLRLTGEARYGAEAERAMFNQLIGAQSPNGTDWADHPPANCPRRGYSNRINCCGSSGPRGLEMYARHLLGISGGVLSVNSYLPMSASLGEFQGPARRIVIEGNYPFEDYVSLKLDLNQPAEFSVDFRLPEGAASMTVVVGGQQQSLVERASGFLRLQRTWQPGETVEIKFDFPLKAHFHSGRDGGRWVAFTRGPLTLAQDMADGSAGGELELVKEGETEDASIWLEVVAAETGGRDVSYRLKGTSAALIPYYLAGSAGNGVRMLFPVKRTKR